MVAYHNCLAVVASQLLASQVVYLSLLYHKYVHLICYLQKYVYLILFAYINKYNSKIIDFYLHIHVQMLE
jgi:hypothetical protein